MEPALSYTVPPSPLISAPTPTPTPFPHSHPRLGRLRRVLGLTCSTRTLFHALLAAALAWVSAGRLLRRPTVGPALAAAAGRSGSSHPRRSSSDNRGCRPPGRAVSSDRARAHTPGRRGQPPAVQPRAPRAAHRRAHAPRPPAPRASRYPHPRCPEAPGDRTLGLDTRTPSYPTPSSSRSHAPLQITACKARRPPTALAFSPTSCGSPLPRLPVFSLSCSFACLELFDSQFSF